MTSLSSTSLLTRARDHRLSPDPQEGADLWAQALGLQSDFPDVERRYKSRSLEKLVAKGLWNVATMFAGDDRQLLVQPSMPPLSLRTRQHSANVLASELRETVLQILFRCCLMHCGCAVQWPRAVMSVPLQ